MLNAHMRPPVTIADLFKRLRKQDLAALESDGHLIDPYNPDLSKAKQLPKSCEPLDVDILAGILFIDVPAVDLPQVQPRTALKVNALPGIYIYPALLPPRAQIALLNKLLHLDLSDSSNKTNVHLHHHVSYPVTSKHSPASFFAADRDALLQPKDFTAHKPLTYRRLLDSKLRWITLGGQYDWTNKVYPDSIPPPFPADVAAFVKRLFPSIEPQAAIVNFYSPGDALSVHRDVSEECDKPLISISIGCDGIFLVGDGDGSNVSIIRLRSGDAVLMSGESRHAWHGVPKILAGTCPEWLQNWPDIPQNGPYKQWRGWMTNKRINLNVRQITD